MDIGVVYTGKIISIEEIEGADFIASATVVCGKGGKWQGVIQKSDFKIGSLATVYLPDALITEEHAKLHSMEFMRKNSYRVRMMRFKGSPSEVVIMPLQVPTEIGTDCTEILGVTKYHKPIPLHMQGEIKGEFPSFIPKTDEPYYQNEIGQEYVDKLQGKPYFITEKADGSSTTAYKFKGQFGVCSRHWELQKDSNNGYWKIAIKHQLEENLPEGFALQWETCGPKIQSNPHGFTEIMGLAFSAYNILEQRYLTFSEFFDFCTQLKFPMVDILEKKGSFSSENIDTLGEGKYKNGQQREGVVVRSQSNELGHKPISFKVINLNYGK